MIKALAWVIRCFLVYLALVATGCGKPSHKASYCIGCEDKLVCDPKEMPVCLTVDITNRI